MKAGWFSVFFILILAVILTAFMIGYSLDRGQIVILEKENSIEIYRNGELLREVYLNGD